MLLQRIAKSVKDQNWAVFVIELLVLVIGVFLGLQVDNWNEARIERNAVKTYYDRLIQDLRTNERGLRAHQDYYQNVKAHGEAALSALQTAPGIEIHLNRRLSDLDTKLRMMKRNEERSRNLADYLESTGP